MDPGTDHVVADSAPIEVPRALPRGPHGLPREVIAASQRWRILEAMADAVAENGYGATSVSDVIARAGVSRRTFYDHFRDKEECFLLGYERGVQVLLAEVDGAAEGEDDPVLRTRLRVRAFLTTLASEPSFAHTFLIGISAAGPRARELRREAHQQFVERARESLAAARAVAPDLPEIPDEIHYAAVAAANEVVSLWVAEGRAAELAQLEDLVLHIQLTLLTPRRPPPAVPRSS
jgi:AcrR family transcriptional regulator